MLVTRCHLRRFDRRDVLAGQVDGALDAPIALGQADKILIGQENGARPAVLGDDDRLAHGRVLIGAKVLRDLGGFDGRCYDADSFALEYTDFPEFPQFFWRRTECRSFSLEVVL